MLLNRAFYVMSLAVLVASCGGGGGGGGTPTSLPPSGSPQVIVIQIKDNEFSPKDVTINPGDTVRWVRVGNAPDHTVSALDGSFDNTFPQSGATFEHTFNAGGKTFEYQCKSHYGCCQMAGAVRVGSNAPDPHPGY
jgi:plastocyanin